MANREAKRQIELFLFKRSASGLLRFLVLKRVAAKGGFWQPITGGADTWETMPECLKREAKEETGIRDIQRIINTNYAFSFSDHGNEYVEYVYGGEVAEPIQVQLSREHTDYRWVTKSQALQLLRWPGNKEGLRRLYELIAK